MIHFNEVKMKDISAFVLRIGIALVMLWFGYQQLSNPTPWVNFLPDWVKTLPVSSVDFIYINGWFEVTFGTLLLLGFYTRLVALLLGLHLLEIAYTVGFGPIGVRDFGLAISAISVFFSGASNWSIDTLFKEKTNL